jgi:16S rRNA (guanine527-N7)-methyltransferase
VFDFNTIKENQKLIEFAHLLEKNNLRFSLLSKNDISNIWSRHIINSAFFIDILQNYYNLEKKSIIDLGSGAGLPGIVIAILLPKNNITLLDIKMRRIKWLNYVVNALNLKNVKVVRGIALSDKTNQEFKVDICADFVVSRAVAPLNKLIPISKSILRKNGTILAMKGENLAQEIIDASRELKGYKYRIYNAPKELFSTKIIAIKSNKNKSF